MTPIFEAWLRAGRRTSARPRVTMRNTGGTDHQSFDAVGLPGFQFIQDPIEYGRDSRHPPHEHGRATTGCSART